MGYQLDFGALAQYFGLFVSGTATTVALTVVAAIAGVLMGIAGAAGSRSRHALLRRLILAYVELIRNTPFIVQMFFLFFGLPSVGLRLNALEAAALAMTINLAAYAIERLRFRGAKGVGMAIFLAYLVPPSILFIPLAAIVVQLGLFDTRFALILTYPTFLIPFCTWLLMGYFRSIPYELEECALIDGATRWQILTKIILPLAVPGLISAGIFAFTLSWNEFIYALTFISSSEVKTVPVGVVTELVEGDVYHWGALMAGALLGSLPVAVLYSFFVEYYVAGMTGAVKE